MQRGGGGRGGGGGDKDLGREKGRENEKGGREGGSEDFQGVETASLNFDARKRKAAKIQISLTLDARHVLTCPIPLLCARKRKNMRPPATKNEKAGSGK